MLINNISVNILDVFVYSERSSSVTVTGARSYSALSFRTNSKSEFLTDGKKLRAETGSRHAAAMIVFLIRLYFRRLALRRRCFRLECTYVIASPVIFYCTIVCHCSPSSFSAVSSRLFNSITREAYLSCFGKRRPVFLFYASLSFASPFKAFRHCFLCKLRIIPGTAVGINLSCAASVKLPVNRTDMYAECVRNIFL